MPRPKDVSPLRAVSGPLARIRRKNDGSAASSSSTTTTTTTTTASNGGTQQEPERRGPGRPKGSTNNKPSDKGKKIRVTARSF